jgi:WD40 repeat protein
LNWTNSDDRWLITTAKETVVRIWDYKSGKQIIELDKHQDFVLSAVFTNDDTKVITVSVDKSLMLWEI